MNTVGQIGAARKGTRAQAIDSAAKSGDFPPCILPVVEMVTHRFLGGADIPYLAKKYADMGRARVEEVIRYGVMRIVRAQAGRIRELEAELSCSRRRAA